LASIWYSWGKELKSIAVLKIFVNSLANVSFFFSTLQIIIKEKQNYLQINNYYVMKKLTKQSLDELARTMCVIPEWELNSILGAYNNDCFWRCVAYMASGGNAYSPDDAESYAFSYFASVSGSAGASAYLSECGAGMTTGDIVKYIQSLAISGNYSGVNSSMGYIGVFNTKFVSNYEIGDTSHAVIVKKTNADGSLDIYDPQLNTNMTISPSDATHVVRAMY